MEGSGRFIVTAQRARARIAHATADDRPLGDQIEDLRDRTVAALFFNGRQPTPANVFLVMAKMQLRREYHGLAHDPAAVIHGTFATLAPAAEGR